MNVHSVFFEQTYQATTKICASCWAQKPIKPFLTSYKVFYITDRTNETGWDIRCGRENYDTPQIGDKIRQSAYIHTDFNKFLNDETV